MADPADRVTLDDEVRMALHLVLERLSAAERTCFVLHDVFGYSHDAIAGIVGRSPGACRQLASRGRRTVRDVAGQARFVVEPAAERQIAERFIAACAGGDLDGLLAVLAPDVDGVADLGPTTVVVTGRRKVADTVLRFLGPPADYTLLPLPAGTGVGVLANDGVQLVSLLSLTVADGVIVHFDSVADPVRLAPVGRVLGL